MFNRRVNQTVTEPAMHKSNSHRLLFRTCFVVILVHTSCTERVLHRHEIMYFLAVSLHCQQVATLCFAARVIYHIMGI